MKASTTDGVSGPMDYTDASGPVRGGYDLWEWQGDQHVVVRQVESTRE